MAGKFTLLLFVSFCYIGMLRVAGFFGLRTLGVIVGLCWVFDKVIFFWMNRTRQCFLHNCYEIFSDVFFIFRTLGVFVVFRQCC